jgi:hypothetical protein
MWRLAVAWIALVACGRIGFEPITSGDDLQLDDADAQGSQSMTGDALPGDTTSPIDNCMYMNCPGGQQACCAAGNTTCVAMGSCVGVVVPCDLGNNNGCPMFERCCANGNSIFCSAALCNA